MKENRWKVAKHEHLTKDRELELGGVIQARAKALKTLRVESIEEARASLDSEPSSEALALIDTIERGDRAITELVQANMGLVYDRARHFKSKFPGAPDMEDLVSMGSIGLMTAVHKYDPTRGNKFSTLAFYWIAQSIGRETNKTGRLVRLPENRISDYSRMNQVASRYEEQALTSTELDEKIMSEVGLKRVELMNIRNAASSHSSLNRKVGGDDGSSKELGDIVAEANPSQGTEYSVVTSDCYSILEEEIEALPTMARKVLAAQFSLSFDGTYPTPQDVRLEHDLSPSKYRRIMSEGLELLRSSLSARDLQLPDFLGLQA